VSYILFFVCLILLVNYYTNHLI